MRLRIITSSNGFMIRFGSYREITISLFDDVVAGVDDDVVAAISGHLHSYDRH